MIDSSFSFYSRINNVDIIIIIIIIIVVVIVVI